MADHCPEHPSFDINCADCREGRITAPLRLHDMHRVFCPGGHGSIDYTDSPSMVQESRAYGIPEDELPQLVKPIDGMFQGIHNKIFPLKCPGGETIMSFKDVVNREAIENFNRELLPYNPKATPPAPKLRDIAVTLDEFAGRVSQEKNLYVRSAIERKVDALNLGVRWQRPGQQQLAARIMPEEEGFEGP